MSTFSDEMDRAVNDVVRKNFDLFFDKDKATRQLREWATKRFSSIRADALEEAALVAERMSKSDELDIAAAIRALKENANGR